MNRLSLEASWRTHEGSTGRFRFELGIVAMLIVKLAIDIYLMV